MREAARYVGVTHRSVAKWVEAACARAKAGGEVRVLDAQVAARQAVGRYERECRGLGQRRASRWPWVKMI